MKRFVSLILSVCFLFSIKCHSKIQWILLFLALVFSTRKSI